MEKDISEASPRLKNYAKKLTRNHDEAEDLFQETLLRICRYHDRHDASRKFLPWAHSIMHNLFVNRFHSATRKQHLLFEDLRNNAFREQFESLFLRDKQDIAQDHELRETFRTILDIIYALDEDQRTLILDDISGEYSYRELADKHKIPLGTVKTRLFRTRQSILKKMQSSQWID